MKRAIATIGAALAAVSAFAALEAVDLSAGVPVRAPCAAKLVAVQLLTTNTLTGATVSLVRGSATNSVATVGATNGLSTAAPASSAYVIPGDGLLLSAGASSAVRATAILEH